MAVFTFKKLSGLTFCLLSLPLFASAEILINEVMYDLPGSDESREWVEIYNNGPEEVTIITGGGNTAWRLSDGLQHTFGLSKGTATIAAGSYAVIVDSTLRFLSEWPGFVGTILDSSFSLHNLFGNLTIMKGKNGLVLGNTTYSSGQGASGDGNSLQLQDNGSWVAAMPTPGLKNSSIPHNSTSVNNNSNEVTPSTHYMAIPPSSGNPSVTAGLGLIRERIGAVGSPMQFKVETNLNDVRYNTFVWNFGDGSQGGGSILSHTYKYPGDYVVILNAYLKEGPAIARINVKIIDPELSILSANSDRIELKNNSAYEVNLFGRALVSGEKFFVFLMDTIIKPGQTLYFGSNVTELSPQGSQDVFIAVLGDAEQPQFKAKIEEQKLKQISYIRNQISVLQKKIEELFSRGNK